MICFWGGLIPYLNWEKFVSYILSSVATITGPSLEWQLASPVLKTANPVFVIVVRCYPCLQCYHSSSGSPPDFKHCAGVPSRKEVHQDLAFDLSIRKLYVWKDQGYLHLKHVLSHGLSFVHDYVCVSSVSNIPYFEIPRSQTAVRFCVIDNLSLVNLLARFEA